MAIQGYSGLSFYVSLSSSSRWLTNLDSSNCGISKNVKICSFQKVLTVSLLWVPKGYICRPTNSHTFRSILKWLFLQFFSSSLICKNNTWSKSGAIRTRKGRSHVNVPFVFVSNSTQLLFCQFLQFHMNTEGSPLHQAWRLVLHFNLHKQCIK